MALLIRELFLFLMDLIFTFRMAFIIMIGMLSSVTLMLHIVMICVRFALKIAHLRAIRKSTNRKLQVAFFHPYCNAGGGSEKVLWVALQAMQEKYPQAEFHIFTGDVNATKKDILTKADQQLNVQIDDKNVHFVYLNQRARIEPYSYNYFTLVGQSIGSLYLAREALCQLQPDIYIDTTGFAFTIPFFKYFGCCKTACYVHYPTTTNMLKRVVGGQLLYSNRNIIARNPFLTVGKLIYYEIFATLYAIAGECADEVMVNSTFTMEHLERMWNHDMSLVYPPCDIDRLIEMPRKVSKPKEIRIFSLSPFRPEKDHVQQLQAINELRKIIDNDQFEHITLVMVGSCRNEEDEQRAKVLKDYAMHLGLEAHVEIKVNISYKELLVELQQAHIGINTTIDESFGIGIVEMMAAGLITVAHHSGGPLLDIIDTVNGSRQGFLSVTAKQYANTLKNILHLTEKELEEIRLRARLSVDCFSTEAFKENFLRVTRSLCLQTY